MSESGSGRDRRVAEYGPLLAGSWEGGVWRRGRGRQLPPGGSAPSTVTSLLTLAGVPTVWLHSFPGAGTVLSFGLALLGHNWGSFCGLGSRRNAK